MAFPPYICLCSSNFYIKGPMSKPSLRVPDCSVTSLITTSCLWFSHSYSYKVEVFNICWNCWHCCQGNQEYVLSCYEGWQDERWLNNLWLCMVFKTKKLEINNSLNSRSSMLSRISHILIYCESLPYHYSYCNLVYFKPKHADH